MNVPLGPKADFDHLDGAGEQSRRHQAQVLGDCEVNSIRVARKFLLPDLYLSRLS
jgi:hypothetical protein